MTQATVDTHQPYLTVDSPYQLWRLRPLVNWVLYIPHAIILYALQILARVSFLLYWLVLVFTGKLQPGLYSMMVMYERYLVRANGFLLGWSEQYPPFEFSTSPMDNSGYPPVRLNLPRVPEAVSRSAALNVFKAIPHYFVLLVFLLGAAVVAVIGWFAVLLTGAWPKGMRDYLVRVSNYQYRIWSYVAMVQNDYPAFGLPST